MPGAPGKGGNVVNEAELDGPFPLALVAITATEYVVPVVSPERLAVCALPTLTHAPEFTLYE